MKRHTDGILIIEGHTDNVGNPEYNLSLSSRRVESVRNYIISKGIAKDRLVSKGYGQTLSLTSNKTAEGRELNRRVELILTK